MIERLHDEPHEPIRLQCSPYHTASALYPVIQRLNRTIGLATGDDEATRLAKFERMIALYGERPGRSRAIYAELLSLRSGGDRFKPADLTCPATQGI